MFEMIKLNNEITSFSKDYEKTIAKIKDGERFFLEIVRGKNADLTQLHRYYRGIILPAFVENGNFSNVNKTHIALGNQFLLQDDLIEYSNEKFIDYLNRITASLRHENGILSYKKLYDKIHIIWVKSTSALTVNEYVYYIKQVQKLGNEYGIEFTELKKIECKSK